MIDYGDGVFETMRLVRGRVPLWPRHFARLALGCERLRFSCPAREPLERELADVADGDGVVRLVVAAPRAARGYARGGGEATRVLTKHDAPPRDDRALTLRWCDTRSAIQPRLAGVKHLNRLEQVLARAEWNDPEIDEGLMLDTEGRVIGATSANVFVRIGSRWLTPALERCGVAGVMRGWILDQRAFGIEVQDILPEMIENADEMVLTNAVRGARAVRRLGAREYALSGAFVAHVNGALA